jgi:hypothetical protein
MMGPAALPARHIPHADGRVSRPRFEVVVNKLFLLPSLALFVVVVAAPARCAAQADMTRLHLTTAFGFGGEQSIDPDDKNAREPPDEDLVATLGFALGAEVPLHTYFTLGGEVGLSWWNTEDRADPPSGGKEYDRHKQLDVLARPKLRVAPISSLELYAVVPVGFTYFMPSKDSDMSVLGVQVDDAQGGPGFAVGGGVGATLFVLEHLGITVEAGYLFRKFRGSLDLDLLGREIDAKISFGQAQLRAGLTLAF